MMKVAVNGRFLLPRLEGIGHYTYQLLDHLSELHPEDEYHVIVDRAVHMPFMDRPNVHRHVLLPPTRHPLLWYFWFEWRIPALLKKVDADVFFSPDGFLSLRTECPSVLTIHDLAFLHYPEGTQRSHLTYLRKYMSQFLQRADEVIAVSQFTSDDIKQQYPGLSTEITTIYNGVSDDFQALTTDDQIACRKCYTHGKPYFIYVGSIHPRKNVAALIRAFDQYNKQTGDDISLVLAGRIAWRSDDAITALRESPYAAQIIQLSDVDSKIPLLIAAAEAMCYVSLFEGFGLPVLEALACGTPVITSAQSSMQEVCGDLAYYVDPRDIDSICKAMIHVRTKQEGIKHNGKKLRLKASEFSWEKAAILLHDRLTHTATRPKDKQAN